MNKRTIVASLNEIANQLDNNGLFREANEVTQVMVKLSQYELSEQEIANSAIANARSIFSDGDKRKALQELGTAGLKIKDPAVKRQLLTVYTELRKSNPPAKMPKLEEAPVSAPDTPGKKGNSIFDKYPVPAPGTGGTKERGIFEKYPIPKPGTMGTDPLPDSPQDTVPDSPKPENKPNVGNKPGTSSTKPSAPGMPSNPGSSKPSAPKSADGLDRWVNKAENIYSAWVTKGAKPGSSAFGLIKDVVDYMQNVKSRLPSSLHSSANAKIIKVQKMMQDIFDGMPDPTKTVGVMPYYGVSGVKGKSVNPFAEGNRLEGKKLDYQADYESKRY
jgi:hypothetical protein